MTKDEFYELIKNHYNVIKDEKKFRALLCDYFPQEKQWRINALLFLYNHGIMEQIEKNSEMKLTEQARLKDELVGQYGMQARNAKWAVELWVKSYGKWVAEETELLNTIKKITESTEWDMKDIVNVFLQAAKYPRVLRLLYKIYTPVIERFGEEKMKSMVIPFVYPIIDKNSVCSYEDYFELYKHLLSVKWMGDYYAYGILLTLGYKNEEYNIRQNSQRGIQWLAYFYEKVNKKRMQICTGKAGATYLLSDVEYMLGMAYAEGKYIKKDQQKAEECWSNMLNESIEKRNSIDDVGGKCWCVGDAYRGVDITSNINKTIKFQFKINANMKLAYEYLVKAVEYGNANAMVSLAEMYEKGEYVDKDVKEARKLYMEADRKGNEDAREWLEKHAEVIECMNE